MFYSLTTAIVVHELIFQIWIGLFTAINIRFFRKTYCVNM